jgi:8-oxo-dGTP pyrophosphatase MutT (NUDIX family)
VLVAQGFVPTTSDLPATKHLRFFMMRQEVPLQGRPERSVGIIEGMNTRWKPSVTVAAIIEREGRYLLVEEETPEGLRLNNPAGHLDPGESPEQGVAREALEETAFVFTPKALVGIYLSRFQRASTQEDVTYLRFAYCGELGDFDAQRPLDTGIVRTLWMTPDEVRASADRHRSPLVQRCIEDHLAGQRFPLATVHTDLTVFQAR